MNRTVLITGIAGFIGFHLAKELEKRGDIVVGIDNFNDYYSVDLKRQRVKQIAATVFEGDICDAALLEKVIKEHQVTHIAHLAAQAGVRYSLENPMAYVKSNVEGFVQILEACRKFPEVKLVYASSSSVYGMNMNVPFSVDDRVDHQVSLYGATKRSNELMADTYHHLYQIPTIGLRFFTVYGPWGRPDMAYFSFTKKILEGEPIQVFNEGKMERDFTYIDDIVEGTIAAIDCNVKHGIFNLGNHQPVSLMEFIETIEECTGIEAEKEFLPMQPGDVPRTYADITDSQRILGFYPKTSLKEGIQKFTEWYLDYYAVKSVS